jgi:hypothetical protein
MAQGVERLPNMLKALGLIAVTEKNKIKLLT